MSEAAYTDDYSGFRDDSVFAAKIAAVIESQLTTLRSPPCKVLDVGCGNGAFLKAAIAAGYQAEGIDVSPAAVAHCQKAGLQARVGDFTEMSFDGGFDLVTMWDVVEHLRVPAIFLSRARSLLNDDGVIVLKIPGFNRGTLRAVSVVKHFARSILGAPDHVQYFNERSCQRMLERCGFTEITWLPSVALRSRPPTRSLKRRLSRTVTDMVRTLSGDHNLIVAVK
jgi:2-polyprenyl-3-methyl-5-hydroxy-6-metoxy-1,4-benzoquinol methylase